MADSDDEDLYKAEFRTRVKQARVSAKMKQWQIAQALGLPQDKYKQYETRSMLPTRLIWAFCMFTRIDPAWLLTGQGKRAPQPLPEVEPDIVPAPKKAPQRASKRSVA